MKPKADLLLLPLWMPSAVATTILFVVQCSCSQGTPTSKTVKTITDVTVRVADDVCKEEGLKVDEPDWVKVACAGESAIVHLLLPASQWSSVKRATRFGARTHLEPCASPPDASVP